jgi:hypothetical protein
MNVSMASPSGVVDEGESSATALRALERRLTLAATDDDDTPTERAPS